MPKQYSLICVLLAMLTANCVTNATYKRLQSEHLALSQERQVLQAKWQQEHKWRRQLMVKADVLSQQLGESHSSEENLQLRVGRLRKNLKHTLEQYSLTHQDLEAMRSEQLASEQRNLHFKQMLEKFKTLVDAGHLTVNIQGGRLVLVMNTDILFQSGSAKISTKGKVALQQVAQALNSLTDKTFQVEGHTDNVPIRTSRFKSNWYLAAARSIAVVEFMLSQGTSPQKISAAAFGKHKPIASNATPQGRQQNRRIELVIIPNLTALADPF